MEETKYCKWCGQDKPISEFPWVKRRARTNPQRRTRCANCRRIQRLQYKKINPDKFVKYAQSRYTKHGDEIRRKKRLSTRKLREEVFAHYGQVCTCCGEDFPPFLSIDHIGGGGKRHLKSIKRSGAGFYTWLKANGFPPGFRTLCISCNFVVCHYSHDIDLLWAALKQHRLNRKRARRLAQEPL
jgi:hypothetical protein